MRATILTRMRHVPATVHELSRVGLLAGLPGQQLNRLAGRIVSSGAEIGRLDTGRRAIAGQDVDCLSLVGQFTACATGSGVLARYDSEEGTIELARYEPAADSALFALPAGAAVIDVTSLG